VSDPKDVLVTLSSGASATASRAFTVGVATQPLGVGAGAPWAVTADGVAPVHLFLAFDGTTLFVSAAMPEAAVTVGGVPVPRDWTAVMPPAEIAFGAARLFVAHPAPPSLESERTVHDGGALYQAAQLAMSGQVPLRGESAPPPYPNMPPAAGRPPDLASPPEVIATATGGRPSAAGTSGMPGTPPAVATGGFWREASPVKKAILVLTPFTVVAAFFGLQPMPEPPRPPPSPGPLVTRADASPAAEPVASAGVASNDGGAPVTAVLGASPDDDVAPKDSLARRTGKDARKRTAERAAVDAVAAGAYVEAAMLYDELAKSNAGDITYKEAARILREKAKRGTP